MSIKTQTEQEARHIMTNGNNDRLDRFGDDLENVKQILFTVARQYEASAERMDATDKLIERLAQKQDRTQAQLDALREDVDIAFQTINLMAENGDQDRTQFRENAERDRTQFQAEILRIWQYLMGQQSNGNGEGPPQ